MANARKNGSAKLSTLQGEAQNKGFESALRERKPDWFKQQLLALPEGSPRPQVGEPSSADEKKAVLLAMPTGVSRPRSSIGKALARFTSACNPAYDIEFDRSVRESQSQWFD